MQLPYSISEAMRPNAHKIGVAFVFATAGRIVTAIDVPASQVEAAGPFWQSNLIAGLRYVETQNPILKFLIFFALSYMFAWTVGRVFMVLDNAQKSVVKHLRRVS